MKPRMNFSGVSRVFFLLITLLGLGVVVGVHELGHLLACKLFHVHAPIYSIGFGKAIWKKQIGNTVYQLAPLPLGGYTQIVEAPATLWQQTAIHAGGEKFFNEISYWQKFIIMMAGIIFNLIFAWLIFLMLVLFPGNLPAPEKESQEEDHLIEVSPQPIMHPIKRIILAPTIMVGTMLHKFRQSYTGQGEKSGIVVGGPILFFSESIKSLQGGFRFFCFYLASFSVSLAFFNLLPIPFLDGGRVVMVTFETVLGRPIPDNIKIAVYLLFLFLMVLMMSVLSARDISRIVRQKQK